MLGPKEIHTQLLDDACVAFEELHGREPTQTEEQELSDIAYNGIGDKYADMIDRARDLAKDGML
jgi:hypothetical protein